MIQSDPKTTNTFIHCKLRETLEDCGFEVEEEKAFYPYGVDLYLPQYHIAFEADGPYHSQKRDDKRDARLMAEYALPVFRVPGKVLYGTIEDIKVYILTLVLGICYNKTSLERREFARESGWVE